MGVDHYGILAAVGSSKIWRLQASSGNVLGSEWLAFSRVLKSFSTTIWRIWSLIVTLVLELWIPLA